MIPIINSITGKFNEKKEKVTPTANASILVARASKIIIEK